MSLLVLMYHRAREGRLGNSPALLDAHFAHLAQHYRHVLPGERVREGQLSVCLTFDDAYFDFYATVFPLLKKHGLRAVLAVVPAMTRDRVDATGEARLRLEPAEAFAQPDRGGFCTWTELQELAQSGRVRMAAHGYSHVRLDGEGTDWAAEIDRPQLDLTERLGRPIDSFVFPFGRYSRPALARARDRYGYVFRIGGAMNYGWAGPVLYRVDADAMESPDALFRPRKLAAYHARFFWNRLRGR